MNLLELDHEITKLERQLYSMTENLLSSEEIINLKIDAAKIKEGERVNTTYQKWLWGVVGGAVLIIVQHLGTIVAPWFNH